VRPVVKSRRPWATALRYPSSSPWPAFFRRRAASSASGPPGPVDCGPRRQPWGSGSY
jgi:hypothetical protein